ncbi:amino acid ABC transporter membrane protein 2 (PAAT family) [Cereibacter ovatus]|uniref:Amino acid ABC transporter membrane protein 2 (PAAT family) n=1 Tax=Cereibacter ovatus TaxID=439529 RepID=A0A285CU59_9RHOB|nr:ABC transporter permease subunit [Cereibacter ovatus]SNX71097.1 amino acid ABC transporter membrane protein 2 (PAAT family) [Cereibacter ovatus]
MIAALIAATPFLAQGFALNLAISALAMGLGSTIGAMLAALRGSGRWWLSGPALFATSLCRNVPSFVLLFYVAFLLPVEVDLAGRIVTVPLWIKATVALTIPVVGFVSDQAQGYRRQRSAGDTQAGATFLVAWLQYLLIILMASSTASVIGADEIVGRANRLIAQDQRPEFLLLTYGYVALWFIVAGLAASWLLRRVTGWARGS